MPPTAGGFPYTDDYDRLIELYDTDGITLLETLNSISGGQNEVADASFEWLRLGGCGSGSMTLNRGFDASRLVCGQWVKISYKADDPWYFGRIESWDATCPVGVTVSLYGPMAVLTEVQAGGQGSWDTRPPHTYAKGDYFVNDPDHSAQSFDSVQDHDALIRRIYEQYIAPYGAGLFPLGEITIPPGDLDFSSVTFRGEESISQILRGLSDACYGASYGIDANLNFFFIPKNEDVQAVYTEGSHLQAIKCAEDRSLMYNRMILVGGYVYGTDTKAGFYRWVSTHFDQTSMDQFGAKQVRIYLPWVRTPSEANNFADGFFNKYAGPTTRYSVTTIKQGGVLLPWMGSVTLEARSGASWDGDASHTNLTDQVNIAFNEAPQFEFTTGPEELQYPIEPEAQRWENAGPDGGDADNISDNYSLNFSFSFSGSGSEGTYQTGDEGSGWQDSSNFPSDQQSDFPSQGDSNFPSAGASNYPSAGASNYPTGGTEDVPSDNASDYPSDNASDFPSDNASNFPSENASNFPSENASNFPSENASNFPSSDASNYPSSDASNYPSSSPPPDSGCDGFVCDVYISGCEVVAVYKTPDEAAAQFAVAVANSPVLAAQFAEAIGPYL